MIRDPTAREKYSTEWAKLIEKEIKDSYQGDRTKVYLAGKSQGGMLSLYTQLMKLKKPIGGVTLFSCFPVMPLMDLLKDTVTAA